MSSTVQIPSVCLPRIFHKFDENYVEGVFCELFGPDIDGNSCVKRVDMITRQDRNTGEPFSVVFVHFAESVLATECVMDFVKRINADDEVKIQYNPPWFWKVRKNKGGQKDLKNRTGPRIMSKRDEEELMTAQRSILQERNCHNNDDDTNSTDTDIASNNKQPETNSDDGVLVDTPK